MEILTGRVLERLMEYYRFLAELTSRRPIRNVTSAQIAKALLIHETQVRKDFAAIGLMGTGHVGFDVEEVRASIGTVLGFDRKYKAVLIGTGHLGSLLATYSGFARYGLEVMAVFDDEGHSLDGVVAGHRVRPMSALRRFVRRNEVALAILAPPTDADERLVESLTSAGLKAIWNFTPMRLAGRPDRLVRNERHFSIGLSEIAYFLKEQAPEKQERRGRPARPIGKGP